MFLKQKSKALCKKIGKVSLASLLSAAVLMSGTGSIAKALFTLCFISEIKCIRGEQI